MHNHTHTRTHKIQLTAHITKTYIQLYNHTHIQSQRAHVASLLNEKVNDSAHMLSFF